MPLLNKYETRYKSFLKMEKRYNELFNEIHKLPLRELKTPYQKGWVITYRLRDDISRRQDVQIIKDVLEAGWNKELYVKDIEAVKAVRHGKKSYTTKHKDINGKFVSCDLRPQRKLINKKTYDELPDKIKAYFYLDTTHESYKKYGREYYYAVLPQYYLELKVRPNMITHERLKGGHLEEEYEFLKYKLQEYWRECNYGYERHHRVSLRRQTRDKIHKFKKGEIDDINI